MHVRPEEVVCCHFERLSQALVSCSWMDGLENSFNLAFWYNELVDFSSTIAVELLAVDCIFFNNETRKLPKVASHSRLEMFNFIGDWSNIMGDEICDGTQVFILTLRSADFAVENLKVYGSWGIDERFSLG